MGISRKSFEAVKTTAARIREVQGGAATVSLSTLPTGANSITATYGSSNFATSASGAVAVVVAPDTTTTSLS
jgi:hypothetical protein